MDFTVWTLLCGQLGGVVVWTLLCGQLGGVAVDVSPQACSLTQENACRLEVAHRLTVIQGGVADGAGVCVCVRMFVHVCQFVCVFCVI